MTEQEQRIKIAEFCGWEFGEISPEDGCQLVEHDGKFWGRKSVIGINRIIPDYLHDLNEIVGVCQNLSRLEKVDFTKHLIVITCPPDFMDFWGRRNDLDAFRIANATAAQRAEALLRTIGKWQD